MADLKRKYTCEHIGCDFSTIYQCNLKQHKRVHDRLRPFSCDHAGCNYAAAKLTNLKQHKLVHDGMRPFACDNAGCGYAAARLLDLERHKRKHLLAYACDHIDCDKAFSTPGRLAAHGRTHSADTTAGCETIPIPGVPGYTVSFDGRVFNSMGDAMAQTILAGYARVKLAVDGARKHYLVHRLVARAFHGLPPDESYTVDHIDREKKNNAASNLRWSTPAEQGANRTFADRIPAKWRPVVFTSSDGRVSEFADVNDVNKAMGVVPGSDGVRYALRTGAVWRGGTWRYNDTAREGVTYRPIPSSSIDGKEGYRAGDDGSIMSPLGRVTFGSVNQHGYRKWNGHSVHRLVAAAFLPTDAARPLVNHIDGVKTHNQLSNLEYATHSENGLHAHATGLVKNGRAVIGTLASGADTQFPSISEAARVIGGKVDPIHQYLRGIRKSAYCGYTWKYVT